MNHYMPTLPKMIATCRRALIIVLTALVTTGVSYAQDANTTDADDKIKNTTITINLDENNCVIEPLAIYPDNCAAKFGSENNPCQDKKDCICSKKDKHITWLTSPSQEFEVQFTASDNADRKTPFKDDCSLKADGDGNVDCKVKHKGTFVYDIAVKACEGSSYDPVIIIQ
ncbi:hypothetical protein QWY77_10905 [Thalassotalea ponticola]|uniref:hypothetical protein n=1 Tax=Thalassotalea ponticola TaxID=1523392 RepID=UPI0025B5104F|nr:hypothetical protein [Thalassotalea ponticola]MDN3653252.1 hypothetical protein [Thalassotalea ponticola]